MNYWLVTKKESYGGPEGQNTGTLMEDSIHKTEIKASENEPHFTKHNTVAALKKLSGALQYAALERKF